MRGATSLTVTVQITRIHWYFCLVMAHLYTSHLTVLSQGNAAVGRVTRGG